MDLIGDMGIRVGDRLTATVGAAEDNDGGIDGRKVLLEAGDEDGEVGERLRGRQVAQRVGRLVRVVPERLRLTVEPMRHRAHGSFNPTSPPVRVLTVDN